MTKIVKLEGFPPACSKIKAEVFVKKIASQHSIAFIKLNNNGNSVDLSFANEDDIDTFIKNLPEFSFGGKDYLLKIRTEQKSDSADESFDDTFSSSFTSYKNDSDGEDFSLLSSSSHSLSMSISPPIGAQSAESEDQFYDCVTPEVSGHRAHPVIEFSRAYTWFDLEDFLTEQNKTALLVQMHDADIGHPQLVNYFEDKAKSNGGPIKKMILMIDGVLITFYHPKMAEMVASKKIHHIDGKQIKLFLKVIPEVFKDRLILKNDYDDTLSEEEMMMEIANLSPNSVTPYKIEPSKVKNVSVVLYKEALEKGEFQTLMEKFKEREFDEVSKILPLPKSDCVIVEGLPGDVQLRKLKLRLENRAYSDGAVITRMDRSKSGAVLAYFASFKHAEDVIERNRKTVMNAFESNLTMRLYFHCLSNLHHELDDEHTLDVYTRTMLDKEVAPMSFEFSEIDSEVLKFVAARQRHLRKLKDLLIDTANVEVRQNSGNTSLKITPISLHVAKDQVDFKNRCSAILQVFFTQFASKKHSSFNIQNLEKVRRANVHRNLHVDGVDDPDSEYFVTWTGSKKEVLFVTGMIPEIDSVIKSIVAFTDISNQTLELSKGKYRWMVEIGEILKLTKASNCLIKQDDEKHTLTFSGTKTSIADAHLKILKSVEPIKGEKFDSLDAGQSRFLLNPNNTQKIVKHVNSALHHMKATFTLENGPHIWCHENDTNKAVIALRKLLVTDADIILTPAQEDAVGLAGWQQELKQLQSKYIVDITKQNLTMVIVGFRDQIEPVKSRIQNFLDEHTIGKWTFQISYGKAQFILECSNELKKCRESQPIKSIGFENGAICIKGKKNPVEKVLGVLKRQKVLEEKYTWAYFRILDYFQNGKGREAIKDASSDHKCIILLEQELLENIVDPRPVLRMEYSRPVEREVSRSSAFTEPRKEILSYVVCKGDITLNQSDAIVNCIGNHFLLKTGGLVCSAILRKGGSTIQSELSKCSGNHIRVTNSGNLPSKCIIHTNFTNEPLTIKTRLKEVLRTADEKNCRSIGIPAIGTGNMKMRAIDIARLMHNVFDDFKASTQIRYLSRIEIVIFDEKVLPAFKEIFDSPDAVFKELHASPPPTYMPVVPSFVPASTTNINIDNSTTSAKMGPFTISVKKGDITGEKSDAIVNSIGGTFDLTQGLVSRGILKKGGNGIQKQLSSGSGSTMRVTSGGNLPCGKIIHVVFPNTEDKMKNCVQSIIERAEEEKCVSLSLPALGTGKLSLPSGAIAKLIREALESYISNNPTPQYLKRIDIVIFDEPKLPYFLRELITSQTGKISKNIAMGSASLKDTATDGEVTRPGTPKPELDLEAIFFEAHTRRGEPYYQSLFKTKSMDVQRPNDSQPTSSNSIAIGAIKLTVRKGDITNENVDAIVNSTGPTFDLSRGQVSKHIINKGGNEIQKELYQTTGSNIRVTSGGKLACRKIIHVVFPNAGNRVKQCLKDIFACAEAEKIGSLSLPAIGTGNLKLPSNTVAKLVSEALHEFTTTAKHLNEVNIVIFEDSKYSDFLRELIAVPKGRESGAVPKMRQQPTENSVDESGLSRAIVSESLLHSSISVDQNVKPDYKPYPTLRRDEFRLSVTDDSDSEEEIIILSDSPPLRSSPPKVREPWTEMRTKPNKPRDSNSICLYFYGAKKNNIQKARKAINSHVELVFEKRTFSVKNLDELIMWKSVAISSMLSFGNVEHNVDETAKKISLSGKKEDTMATMHKIDQLAAEFENAANFQSIALFSWEYCDSKNQWKDFGAVGSSAAEEAYAKKWQKCDDLLILVNGKAVKFAADFDEMKIRSKDPNNSFEYKIRRDIKDKLPRHWEGMAEDDPFRQISLDTSCDEYAKVKKMLLATISNCKIHSICRIQNKTLYFRYQQEKRRVKRICSAKEIERVLFHGTSDDIGDKIAHEGFDRGYAGAHAVAFGNGVYFAKDASYSNKDLYAQPNGKNVKTILVAKVITGDYCLGKKTMKSAPAKQLGGTELYNCAVNNMQNPTIFVVFVDVGAYPEYMIKYTG